MPLKWYNQVKVREYTPVYDFAWEDKEWLKKAVSQVQKKKGA